MSRLADHPVHVASPTFLLLTLPHGGFGIVTAASLGGDALAEGLLGAFARRGTARVVATGERSGEGYRVMGASLRAGLTRTPQFPPAVRKAAEALHRATLWTPIGRAVVGTVVKKGKGGGIVVRIAAPAMLTAVVPTVEAARVGEDIAVRVVAVDPATGVATAVADEGASLDAEEWAGEIRPGDVVTATVVAKLVTHVESNATTGAKGAAGDGGAHVGTVVAAVASFVVQTAAGESSVLAHVVRMEDDTETYARGTTHQLVVEFVPTTADEVDRLPVVLLSARKIPEVFRIHPTRREPPVHSIASLMPWREKSSADAADEEEAPKMRKRRMEEALDAAERAGDAMPTTPEGFDKALIGRPNSSLLWTHYMAHHVALGNIEGARIVADRALRTIGVRETREHLNVWAAYLNLENIYGTAESLAACVQRATRECDDPQGVHEALAATLRATGKWGALLNLRRAMTTKYASSPSVWISLGTLYVDRGERESLRRMLKSLSQSRLSSTDQTQVAVRIAIHEYVHGSVSSGRGMFEAMVARAPKRCDVWMVYIDHEQGLIKRGSAEGSVAYIRTLFERLATLPLAPRTMQRALRAFLSFEVAHGSPEDVTRVKQRARMYVESKLGGANGSESKDPEAQ